MTAITAVLLLAGVSAPAGADDAAQPVGFTPTEGLHEGAWVEPEPGVWEPTPGVEGPGRLAICRSVEPIDPEQDCQVGLGADRTGIPIWSEFEEVAVGWSGVDADTETVRVARVIALPDGLHDCRTDGCALAIEHGGVMTEPVPVSFGPEWAPWASAEAFVDAVLLPLPLRPVSAAERDALVAEVASGDTPNRDIVLRLAREAGVDATVGEVVRQYGAAFGRRPETGGLAYWEQRARDGMSPEHMARAFAGTSEARATYDHLESGEIVDRLYGVAFDRTPEPAGRAYWIDRLDGGLPLWRLIWHVARSPEMRTRWADRGLATALSWAWHDETADRTVWAMGGIRYARFAMAGDWPGAAPGRG